MMQTIYSRFSKTIIPSGVVALVMALIMTACASGSVPVEAVITSPAANAEVTVGEDVSIQGQVTGDNITRVELVVDSASYASMATGEINKGVSSFPVQVTWKTQLAGAHFAQLNVYGLDDKLIGKSEPLIFIAKPAPAKPTATPVATATPIPAPPTATPKAATVTTSTAAITPILTITNEYANIRSGPGTQYELVGKMLQGETAPVRGKNADGTWWQITYTKSANGIGWVRGDLVQVNSAAQAVQVAAAPAIPTSAPATPSGVAAATSAATTASTPAGPVCDQNSPDWRGANPNYPFCAKQDVVWGDPAGDWNIYDNGKDIPLSISWNLYGAAINQVWLHFDQSDSACDFARPAQKTINQQVPAAYTFRFNAIDFPLGGTFRVYLAINLTDGRTVTFGEKRLCIR